MITRTVILEADGLKIAGQLYRPAEGDQAVYPTVCVGHGIPSGNPPDSGIAVIEGAGHRLRQDDRAMVIVIDWLKSQWSN